MLLLVHGDICCILTLNLTLQWIPKMKGLEVQDLWEAQDYDKFTNDDWK
jgi:hypothetical protein